MERIREIGKDPELVAEVVCQPRMQVDGHRVTLDVEQRQLEKDLRRERASLRRLAGEQSRNGNASARLAAVRERVDAVVRRLAAVAQDLDAVNGQSIEERHVATALSAFDSMWGALIPTERARILGLLTERITYDGRTQTLELTLRSSGIGNLHEIQTV